MHSVKFNIFAEHGISLPLVILMLISLTVGAILGVFAMLGRVLSLRSEVNSLKRAKKKAEKIAGKLEESISSKDNE
ncbi:MAG: LapA family protein [Neisseriaceae bacterium]|nr:LapA family protein [Neisseriaceae bacterium]